MEDPVTISSSRRASTWATPASPTRPGPPVTFRPVQPSAVTAVPVIPVVPVAPAPPVLTVEDTKEEKGRKDEIQKEQRRVDRAIEAERRRRERRIPEMDDDDLEALMRSAQKLVRSVHIAPPAYPDKPEDELDLNPAELEEFSLDKLRSHLERFYSSVVFSCMTVIKEVIRIRGWEDGGERTGVALAVYIIAWYFGLIITTFFLFLTILVLVPPSRAYCFGPRRHYVSVPLDPSDPSTLTTLPILEGSEEPWGPAASERQATAWADKMESVIFSLFSPGGAKSDKGKEVIEHAEEEINGVMVKDMKHKAKNEYGADDMGKREMAKVVYGKPGMQILGGLVDKWERIANAIKPTPPFVKPSRDRVFYTLLLPLIIASLVITPTMVSRACGAGFGFVLFGKPVIDWTIDELDRRVPTWRRKLILEFNILADVPTNPQLILRLMRDAEHQRRPLPHPETEQEIEEEDADAEENEDSSDDGLGDETSDREDDGAYEDEGKKAKKKVGTVGKKMKDGTRAKVRKTWDKLGMFKEESFALVTGHKKVNFEEKAKNVMDKLNISHDSKPAAKLLDKLPGVSEDDSPDTPTRFYVNHAKHGPGHLIIYPPTLPTSPSEKFTPARISLTTIRRVPTSQSVSLHPDQLDPTSDHLNPHSSALTNGEKGDLVISINDIIAMKKTGLGYIASMGVSWALDTEDAGGTGLDLTIIRRAIEGEKEDEMRGKAEKVELRKIVRRDELFDRLLALGEQRWELM